MAAILSRSQCVNVRLRGNKWKDLNQLMSTSMSVFFGNVSEKNDMNLVGGYLCSALILPLGCITNKNLI